MRKIIGFLALVGFLGGCHKEAVKPEVKATILGSVSPPYAGCNFNYELVINNEHFLSKSIAEPYDKAGTQVWLRYQLDETCSQYTPRPTNIITITSIRSQ